MTNSDLDPQESYKEILPYKGKLELWYQVSIIFSRFKILVLTEYIYFFQIIY